MSTLHLCDLVFILRVQSGAFMTVNSPQQPTAYHVHPAQRGLLVPLILVLSYSVVVDKGKRIIDTGMSNVQLWRWMTTNVRDLRESGDDYASVHFPWSFKYETYLNTWVLKYQVPAAEKRTPCVFMTQTNWLMPFRGGKNPCLFWGSYQTRRTCIHFVGKTKSFECLSRW
jgi:hypothetical protein